MNHEPNGVSSSSSSSVELRQQQQQQQYFAQPHLSNVSIVIENGDKMESAYIRTRHNNLRCFPQCAKVHKIKSFCGTPLYVRIGPAQLFQVKELQVIGEFRNLRKPPALQVMSVCTPDTVAANQGVFVAGHLSGANDDSIQFTINPPRKWRYRARIAQVMDRHVFTVYVVAKDRVVAVKDTKPFQVIPIWKADESAFPKAEGEEGEEEEEEEEEETNEVESLKKPSTAGVMDEPTSKRAKVEDASASRERLPSSEGVHGPNGSNHSETLSMNNLQRLSSGLSPAISMQPPQVIPTSVASSQHQPAYTHYHHPSTSSLVFPNPFFGGSFPGGYSASVPPSTPGYFPTMQTSSSSSSSSWSASAPPLPFMMPEMTASLGPYFSSHAQNMVSTGMRPRDLAMSGINNQMMMRSLHEYGTNGVPTMANGAINGMAATLPMTANLLATSGMMALNSGVSPTMSNGSIVNMPGNTSIGIPATGDLHGGMINGSSSSMTIRPSEVPINAEILKNNGEGHGEVAHGLNGNGNVSPNGHHTSIFLAGLLNKAYTGNGFSSSVSLPSPLSMMHNQQHPQLLSPATLPSPSAIQFPIWQVGGQMPSSPSSAQASAQVLTREDSAASAGSSVVFPSGLSGQTISGMASGKDAKEKHQD